MKQKDAFAAIRALGMVVKVTDGEYRVNYKGGTEAAAYYTNDADDAVGTARAMLAHRQAREKNPAKRKRGRNPSLRSAAHAAARKWVILADKRKGGMYYYAGGARLATEKHEAVLFPSHASAGKALQDLTTLVPRNLAKLFEWSVAAVS